MRLCYGMPGDIDAWMDLVTAVRAKFPGLETAELLEEHRKTVLKFMSRGEAICVKDDERIAGVLLFSSKHNMICCLAVAPECRRRGAASMLMEAALGKMDPARPVTVTTYRAEDRNAEAARALYQKFGFAPGRLVEEMNAPLQEFIKQ